jgi:hypothetical protein
MREWCRECRFVYGAFFMKTVPEVRISVADRPVQRLCRDVAVSERASPRLICARRRPVSRF